MTEEDECWSVLCRFGAAVPPERLGHCDEDGVFSELTFTQGTATLIAATLRAKTGDDWVATPD